VKLSEPPVVKSMFTVLPSAELAGQVVVSGLQFVYVWATAGESRAAVEASHARALNVRIAECGCVCLGMRLRVLDTKAA